MIYAQTFIYLFNQLIILRGQGSLILFIFSNPGKGATKARSQKLNRCTMGQAQSNFSKKSKNEKSESQSNI